MDNPFGRVVCFGEAMLRTAQRPDGSVGVTAGGAEYNVACALARLQVNTVWVSALPADETAEKILKPASEAGVRVELTVGPQPIGTYLVHDGSVEYDRGDSAFANLEAGAIDWRTLLGGARWLVVSGITPLLGDGPRSNWGAAMTFAELDGTLVALDLNHREALGSFVDFWNDIEPRLRQIHLLVLSPANLLTLAGSDEEGALSELRSKWNLPYLACTWKRNGKRWSAVAHSMGVDSTSDRPVSHQPIEPLGGGDAWLAGFLDGLLHRSSPEECCHRGDLLAALTQRSFGDLGEVTREELLEWESIEGAVDLSGDR